MPVHFWRIVASRRRPQKGPRGAEHDQARAARTRRAYNSWRHHSQPPAAAQIDRDQHEAGRDGAFSSILAKPSRAKQRTQAASDACRKIKKEARRKVRTRARGDRRVLLERYWPAEFNEALPSTDPIDSSAQHSAGPCAQRVRRTQWPQRLQGNRAAARHLYHGANNKLLKKNIPYRGGQSIVQLIARRSGSRHS